MSNLSLAPHRTDPVTGALIPLAPLPALEARCPECGGYIKFAVVWQCRTCAWTELTPDMRPWLAAPAGDAGEEMTR